MNSFNVYNQTETKVGGNTPVWLGTVKPVPVGAKLSVYLEDPQEGERVHLPAGLPVLYNAEDKSITLNLFEYIEGISDFNAYLYNDVDFVYTEDYQATAAVVMYHPEGLLIDRVGYKKTNLGDYAYMLQKNIPGVLLVGGRRSEPDDEE